MLLGAHASIEQGDLLSQAATLLSANGIYIWRDRPCLTYTLPSPARKKNPKLYGFGFKSTSNEEVEETTAWLLLPHCRPTIDKTIIAKVMVHRKNF